MKVEIPNSILVTLSGQTSRGVKGIEVREADGHLIFTLTDGKEMDMGSVMGPQGPKGDTGAKGEKGDRGEKGDTGATGAKGDKGDPGATGPQGITPTIGENENWYLGNVDTGKPSRGRQGEKGEAGAKGEKGDKGDKGDPGAKGEKGDTGETGPQGPVGADGADGENGITPHIEETTKHWMIGNTDTGIVAEGKTSYIGDNGNWYEWDATSGTFVDSGVSAHPFSYVQPDDPIDAPEFSLWVDTDEEALYIARAEGVGF